MVDVPSTSQAGEKFARRGSQAGQDFNTGVENSSDQEWQSGTLDNVSNWEQGVQDAIANGSFESGVRNPAASWQQRTLEVGSGRFTQGVQAAQGKYETAVQPFFDALEALTLEPRGPRGSAQNFNRSQAVGQRLNEIRDTQ